MKRAVRCPSPFHPLRCMPPVRICLHLTYVCSALTLTPGLHAHFVISSFLSRDRYVPEGLLAPPSNYWSNCAHKWRTHDRSPHVYVIPVSYKILEANCYVGWPYIDPHLLYRDRFHAAILADLTAFFYKLLNLFYSASPLEQNARPSPPFRRRESQFTLVYLPVASLNKRAPVNRYIT